jgi:hypothetical protein
VAAGRTISNVDDYATNGVTAQAKVHVLFWPFENRHRDVTFATAAGERVGVGVSASTGARVIASSADEIFISDRLLFSTKRFSRFQAP